MKTNEVLTLRQLNAIVVESVKQSVSEPVWMTAEISEARTAAGGHCYLEFIDKSTRTGNITARAKGTIWANRWWMLKEMFEKETGQTFAAGLKVLVLVQPEMHELYGYSLNVVDIDPTYTVGEMARRRAEIIRQLTEEGIIDLNKELSLPLLPQRIAVISAAGAAGYGDFCKQLTQNRAGWKFYPHLFAATMQGDKTEASILEALDRIYQYYELFDAVVIIRGGGATADLAAFDSYLLAAHCAQFPLPILVGIGHDRDKTILDEVAHTSLKTPTAVATFLIECMDRQANRLAQIVDRLRLSSRRISTELARLDLLKQHIALSAKNQIAQEKQKIKFSERTIEIAHPENILRRGFSITRHNGHAITTPEALQAGDIIETYTAHGMFRSEVTPLNAFCDEQERSSCHAKRQPWD